MGRRGRSEDVAGYLDWRKAEAEGGTVEDVAARMPADVRTVGAWRVTIPSVAAWRAWCLETWGADPAMAALIAAGAFDDLRRAPDNVVNGERRMLSTVVPALDRILTDATGERPTDGRLASLTGSSRRTVRRYRTG